MAVYTHSILLKTVKANISTSVLLAQPAPAIQETLHSFPAIISPLLCLISTTFPLILYFFHPFLSFFILSLSVSLSHLISDPSDSALLPSTRSFQSEVDEVRGPPARATTGARHGTRGTGQTAHL